MLYILKYKYIYLLLLNNILNQFGQYKNINNI